MSFTDDLKAALGGAVSDALVGQPGAAPSAASPYAAILDPLGKAGLGLALGGAAPAVTPPGGASGIAPGVYSVKTPPPTPQELAARAKPRVPPVVIGAALLALVGLAWYATRKASA